MHWPIFRVPRLTGKTRITGKTTEIPERPKNNRGLFPVLNILSTIIEGSGESAQIHYLKCLRYSHIQSMDGDEDPEEN